MNAKKKTPISKPSEDAGSEKVRHQDSEQPREHGGPQGPEPTRYGDWERNGRCFDF